LVSVAYPKQSERSWVRLERTGDVGGSEYEETRDRAGFLVIIAPSRGDLIHQHDESIAHAEFGPSTLWLYDLACFARILNEVVPRYTLLYHNCWWFARQLFKSLISEFLPENYRKKDFVALCIRQEKTHVWKFIKSRSSHSVNVAAFVLSAPIHHIAFPVAILGGGTLSVMARRAFRTSEEGISVLVETHMQERLSYTLHPSDNSDKALRDVLCFLMLLISLYLVF